LLVSKRTKHDLQKEISAESGRWRFRCRRPFSARGMSLRRKRDQA
jgi:hypothetical protein